MDKASEKQKEASDKEEDLRKEWLKEDIESEGRKPNLEEMDEDPEVL
ncbi:MAG: hypothetical protein M3N93_14330 [Acidobacteriota bacterium]|nr:hypothetical protein [Acidobacteriota bacterium]